MQKRYILMIGLCVVMMASIYSCAKNDGEDTSETSKNKFEAPHISEQVSMDFVLGNYDKVKEAAEEIHRDYPGSYDETYVQEYIKLIENREKEAEKAIADIDVKNCVQMLKLKTGEPNSAGGVDLFIECKNTSDKTIKYAYFTCDLYNAVDDRVEDTISHSYSFTGKVTGPIEPGQIIGKGEYFQNAWWNNSGKYAKLTQIKIEYMDGTEIEIPQSRTAELFY